MHTPMLETALADVEFVHAELMYFSFPLSLALSLALALPLSLPFVLPLSSCNYLASPDCVIWSADHV